MPLMTISFRLATRTALAIFASGCGGRSSCDELADFIAECGVAVPEASDGTGIECGDDTRIACESECGLAAGCDLFAEPVDQGDQAFIDLIVAHGDCVRSCSDVTP